MAVHRFREYVCKALGTEKDLKSKGNPDGNKEHSENREYAHIMTTKRQARCRASSWMRTKRTCSLQIFPRDFKTTHSNSPE